MILEKQYLWRTLRQFGSDGYIYRRTDSNSNRYNEEGEELDTTDSELFEKYKCKYSISTQYQKENTNISKEDISRIVTVQLVDSFEPMKSDVFIDSFENRFTIDEVWRLGDKKNDRVFYRLKCLQD
jgi:hypothetical protein